MGDDEERTAMRKATLKLLRPAAPTASEEEPSQAADSQTDQPEHGLITETEIWSMAAFRLHDAATWMIRLATASASAPLRTRLLELYDELTRQEQELIRRAEAPDQDTATAPHPQSPTGRGPRR